MLEKKVDRRSCRTYGRNFILSSQPLFHHLLSNPFTPNIVIHPPLLSNTFIFKSLSFSAYLEINSSPPSQASPIAAYLLLGLALTQTHITNRSVRMLNSVIARMVERELTKFSLLSRYLLLLLVAHAVTMEHIGEHIPVPQALFTGVK